MIKLAIELMGWMKTNWLPIVIFATFITYSLLINNSAYDRGYANLKTEWNAEKLQMAMDIQAEKNRLADEFNKKSSEFEVRLANERIKNQKLNARVKDAIKKNDAYAKCLVDDAGLHAYNDSIAKAGDTR